MTDWSQLDAPLRRSSSIEVDLVESYARGTISRRDFVNRGMILGLSTTFIGTVAAACSTDEEQGAPSITTTSTPVSSERTATSAAQPADSAGSVIVGIQRGDENSGLDPLNMSDAGTYAVVTQCFEYLVGIGGDGNIGATGLAASWAPNEDGSVWTFEIRPDVRWQSGAQLTAADVAATMDRLARRVSSDLFGVIEEGSTDATNPSRAVITLLERHGNFPVLLSASNPQSVITPANYSDGTTLDERVDGTGPWRLERFEPETFVAHFKRNSDWWGGTTPLRTAELRGFTTRSAAADALLSREIDVVQQFTVQNGGELLDDEGILILQPPSAAHRQLWVNTRGATFEDSRVRQAIGWALDREQIVAELFSGRAEVGNDHPILASLPFFDPAATPQRRRNIETAKSLLAEAGSPRVTGTIECGDIEEIPKLAAIVQRNVAEAGFDLVVNVHENSTFYGNSWCPGPSQTDRTQPCSGSADFGIVDYGHLPLPDQYLSLALASGGSFNSSNYANPKFDRLVSDYRRSVDVEAQRAAIGSIQKILHDDNPACYPYFVPYLAAHNQSVSGVQMTALGHVFLGSASTTR